MNFTRVTEKFMSSLLSNITGGIVSMDNSIGVGGINGDNITTSSSNSSSNNNNNRTTTNSAKSPNKKKGK